MPCHTEIDEIKGFATCTNPNDSRWRKYADAFEGGKMSLPPKSLVYETVHQLCSRNNDLNKVGVTHKQLHSVLSLRLSRGSPPTYINTLIEREVVAKTLIKNSLGNYIMNPDPDNSVVPEESSSDSGPETKGVDSTTEKTVDSSNTPDIRKSENSTIKINNKSNEDVAKSRSPSPAKMDIDETENSKPDKPVKRRRRTRKPKIVELDSDEPEEPERSPSPPPRQAKRTGRSVLVTNSNGRRVIRKITKYDPSEFYMTPLIRKKNKGVVEEPKVKLKRGRPPCKAKLAAAAGLAANSSIPQKKLGQIKFQVKPCKSTVKPNKSVPVEEPSERLEAEDEREEEEQVPLKSKASMLRNECYICSESADVNDDKSILACSLCLNIAHKNCVVDDGFYKELKKWRCTECLISNPVVCSVCDKEYKKSDGAMVMCDFCEEMFHVQCHIPPVKLSASNCYWRCSLCPQISIADTLIGGRVDLKSAVGTFAYSVCSKKSQASICAGSSYVPISIPPSELPEQPAEPPVQPPSILVPLPIDIVKTEPPDVLEETEYIEEEIEDKRPPSYKFHRPGEPIPKVDDWTSKQVADYFSERFGAVVGNAFLMQEIDGRSLKLLKRKDVTDQLGLQFGIALKVLYYVKKIQLNTNVIQELWM